MSKNTLSDWDTNPDNNTDVSGISLAESVMRPPAVNNAFRAIMAQVASWLTGPTFAKSDDGATAGPILTLKRTSASPAAGDILGQTSFVGKDSAGNDTTYGTVSARIEDATDGSEDGSLALQGMVAGSLTTLARFQGAMGTAGQGAVVNSAGTAIEFVGARSFSANGYVKLPSGLIIQWGALTITGGDIAVTFPTAFPTACYAVVATTAVGPDTTGTVYAAQVDGVLTGSFALHGRFAAASTAGLAAVNARWIAVGQ